ncbi:MAG: AMIN domain-containing protein [Acidobacteriia bacterium]|nr:AMIN domain-containing protein [Terriglobia bacterium]
MPRISPQLMLISLLAGVLVPSSAKAQSKPQPPATIARVRVLLNQTPPALEIISSHPLRPEIKRLDNPPRLVIDLPNALMSVPQKRIEVHSDQISAVRLNQYQKVPPIVRVVIDLLKPSDYTSDATGNLLTIHLRPAGVVVARKPVEPPTVPAFTRGVQPVVVPVSPGTSGAVVLAGSRLASGSSVTAGAETAVLHLGRGGEVRVCPGTSVSVTSSKTGRDLMLGMSTGALEAHYKLEASADSVVTPDFRILLAGPGEFHYAISADARGNTCVRALPGNTSSVIVSELMGDGTYQVKPSDQIVFHSGRLTAVDTAVPGSCGCPEPPVPVMRASAPSAPPIPDANLAQSMRLAPPTEQAGPVPPPVATSGLRASGSSPSQVSVSITGPESAPLPASKPNDVHVQVDAPFVFRASDPTPPPPAPIQEAQRLPLSNPSPPERLQTTVLPPPTPPPPTQNQAKPPRRGFLGKIRGFFAAIFH